MKVSRRLQRHAARYSIDRRRFERLVARALSELPEQFRSRIDNVAVVVEERPDPRRLAELGYGPDEDLLGLYEGVPLGDRGTGYSLVLPDRITIFRQPILAVCRSEEEVVEEVKLTVMHEIAHYFGISDEELDF